MKRLSLVVGTLLALSLAPASAAVITGFYYIAPLDFSYDGQDLTVTAGQLNINGNHTFAALTLLGGSVLTHDPAAPGQVANRIDLQVVTDVFIDPSSKIDVSGLGYNGLEPGPGAGVTGTNGNDYGSGGAYGGFGANSSGGAPGGTAYGSLSQPTDYGSAGGACPSHDGTWSPGGGSVHITAGGAITLQGKILANGGSDVSGSGDYEVGGGAGGSIWLTAELLAGAGLIRANGGGGDMDGDSGGGGGGRIALYYRATQFTGQVEAQASLCSFPGGAGTIYTRSIGQTNATVRVDNGGHVGTATGIWSAEWLALTATNGGVVAALNSLDLVSLAIGTNGGVTCGAPGNTLVLNVSGDVVVDKGGSIQVDGMGYPLQQNLGPGAAPASINYAGGGSYGGFGGAGWSSAPVGTVYGSITQPTALGSAGGTGDGEPGSAGGGAMNLKVSGTLTLNGVISANGVSSQAGHGGCGSGGSILLNLNTLQGNGIICANGGSSPKECDGGGGGGGRVAIYYTNAAGFSFLNQAFAVGGGPSSCPSRIWGGPGTVFYRQSSGPLPGNLLIGNGGNLGPPLPLLVFQDWGLTVISNGVVELSDPATLGSLSVASGGILTADSTLKVVVEGDAQIAPTGALNLDGKGYPRGRWQGPGTAPTTNDYAGGASYGGIGGSGWNDAPSGAAYGSLLQPTDLGSAGGKGNDDAGSAGGGAIQLTVTGTLTHNGAISANGISDTPGHGGCGSGGSIWLTVGTLQGSGTISANGGSGPSDCDGGAGGGGRVAIYYTNTAGFNLTNQVAAHGGGPFTCPNLLWGGAGTIYLQGPAPASGDLRLDNGGHQAALTPITSPLPFTLTISGGAAASASRGLTLSSLHVATNSLLTDLPGDPSLDVFVIGNAQLDLGSRLSADATGYPVGTNQGPGAPTATNDYAGGGGYGGVGGKGYDGAPGGFTYGLPSEPVDLGSAGGTGFDEAGTAGGGAIRLTVSGSLTHNGLISANGGSDPTEHGGCGSGGSIWVNASTLSGAGHITAAGGTGLADCDGGSGGGGRIAVYYGTLAGFDLTRQLSAPAGGPKGCPALLGSTGTVFTALMTGLPTLTVLSSTPNGGPARPWADGIDLMFNMPVDPATFSAQDVAIMTPSGLLPTGQLSVSNLGGTRWHVAFPRQLASGTYEYSVGPQIADLKGTSMTTAYVGGFTVGQTNGTSPMSWSHQGSTLACSVHSVAGLIYQPAWSEDLINWTPFTVPTVGDGSVLKWSFPISTTGQLFYRLQLSESP